MPTPANAIDLSTSTYGVVSFDGSHTFGTIAPSTSGNVLTSNGSTWSSQAPAGGSITIDGDSGSASGSTITLNAHSNSGDSVTFTASSSTVDLNLSDSNDNIILGSGTTNTGHGGLNSVLGVDASIVGGISDAVIVGFGSSVDGDRGICLGKGSESGEDCITLAYGLTNTTPNTIHIGGGTGTDDGQQDRCFVSGINGVTASNALMVTINSSTDQLGVASIPVSGSIAFTSYLSSDSSNATGDGTAVDITFDSTTSNIGSTYSTGTGLFTAPATGLYMVNVRIAATGLSASTNYTVEITEESSGDVYSSDGAVVAFSGEESFYFSQLIHLASAETLGVSFTVYGGTKTVTIHGDTDAQATQFSVFRVA